LTLRFWRTAAAVIGAIVLLNYLPIFTGKIPFPRDLVVRHSAWNGEPQEQLPELIDIVAMFYPFRALLARGGEERALPLWNPHIMSGAPFLANAQSAVFAPLNVVYYVLPLKIAWTVNLLLRLFLAGMFMTLFVRSLGASATGAIVSGILFAFCGFTIQWQGMSNGDTCIWLPLMCYAVLRLHRHPNAVSIAIAALAFSIPVLSGHPETAAHSVLVACVFAAFLMGRAKAGRFLATFTIAALLAVGLAAVQIIPTFEWLGQLGLQVEAPQPVLDRHQGQGLFSRDITRNPSSAGLWIPEASAYVGMIGFLGASLAWFHRSRRYVYFLLAITVIAATVAYGVQPIRWVVVHLPIIKAMKNGRLTLVVDFALAALAGLGISAIGEQFWTMTALMRKRAIQFAGIAFIVVSLGIYEVHRATLTPVQFWRSPVGSFVFLVAALLLIALRLRGVVNERSFSILVCSLAGIEMLSFSYGYTRFSTMPDVFPPAGVIDFIQTRDNSTPFRVAKDRFPIPHDAGMVYGFESADGYDLTTQRTRLFHAGLIEDREDGIMFLAEKILAAADRRFDMLNVRYLMVSKPGPEFDMVSTSSRFTPVFSQGRVAVFENKMALPRFLAVPLSGIEVRAGFAAQLERMQQSSFDPERSVVLPEMPRDVSLADAKPGSSDARVQLSARGLSDYRLRMDSSAPAVLVISQMYYPGWRATIDGVETQVYPVNAALTGIIVSSGSHDVRLFFQPASFRIGFAISLVSLIIVGLLALTRISDGRFAGAR